LGPKTSREVGPAHPRPQGGKFGKKETGVQLREETWGTGGSEKKKKNGKGKNNE